MLVLSRKPGERICIGEGIELEVIAIQGRRVKLGIACPDDVRILRAELLPSAHAASAKNETASAPHFHAAAG